MRLEGRDALPREPFAIGLARALRARHELGELRPGRRRPALLFMARREASQRPVARIEALALGELRAGGRIVLRVHQLLALVEEDLGLRTCLVRAGCGRRESQGERQSDARDGAVQGPPHLRESIT